MPCCLDTGAVPAAALGVDAIDITGSSASTTHNPEAKNSRSQEEDGSKEAESNICFILITSLLASDSIPVPNASTSHTINVVCQQTECDHPEDEEDEIHRPFCEGAQEGKEEEEGEEDGD